MALSNSQFGGEDSITPPPPLSLSAATAGSTAQATAWRNNSLGGGRPLSFSKKTRGTTYNWDDTSPTQLPESDKGAR